MVTVLQVFKSTSYIVVVPIVVYLIIYSKRLQWGGNCYGISEQVACMGTWIGVIISSVLYSAAKKFPAYLWNQSFIILLTRICYWTLYYASLSHFIQEYTDLIAR